MTYRKQLAPILSAQSAPVKLIGAIIQWCNTQFSDIESNLTLPEVRGLQFEELYAVPDRYREGDLYRFAAGVVPGAPGLFIRDANSWKKL